MLHEFDYILDVSIWRLLTEKSSLPKNITRQGGPLEPHLFFNETAECENDDFPNIMSTFL